jgi:hypothetical protein
MAFHGNGRRRPGRLARTLISRTVGAAAVLAAVTVAVGGTGGGVSAAQPAGSGRRH